MSAISRRENRQVLQRQCTYSHAVEKLVPTETVLNHKDRNIPLVTLLQICTCGKSRAQFPILIPRPMRLLCNNVLMSNMLPRARWMLRHIIATVSQSSWNLSLSSYLLCPSSPRPPEIVKIIAAASTRYEWDFLTSDKPQAGCFFGK